MSATRRPANCAGKPLLAGSEADLLSVPRTWAGGDRRPVTRRTDDDKGRSRPFLGLFGRSAQEKREQELLFPLLCLWAACAPDFLLCGSRSTRRPYSPAPVPRPTPVSPTRKCLVLRGLCVFLARFQAKRKSKRRSFRCCSLFPRACFRFFSEPDTRSELRPRPHYTPHYHTLTIITTPLHEHLQQ